MFTCCCIILLWHELENERKFASAGLFFFEVVNNKMEGREGLVPSSKESALVSSPDKDTIEAWPQVSHELICHLVEQFLAEHNYTSTLAAFEKES